MHSYMRSHLKFVCYPEDVSYQRSHQAGHNSTEKKSKLDKHIVTQYPLKKKKMKEPFCLKVSCTDRDIQKLRCKKQSSAKKFKCSACSIVFRNARSLQNHQKYNCQKISHDAVKISCPDCGSVFKNSHYAAIGSITAKRSWL